MPGLTGLEIITASNARNLTIITVVTAGKRDAHITCKARSPGAMTVLEQALLHEALFRSVGFSTF
jgi:FixJ family two-component response regulator